jgi:hypothetical protein
MTPKKIQLIAVVTALTLLGGCADKASPEQVQSSPEEISASVSRDTPVEFASFTTKNGVQIHFSDIGSDTEAWNLPVVSVAPRYYTEEDARRLAQALFGSNAVYYEHRMRGVRPMTKSVITDKIALFERLLEDDTLEKLYGNQPEVIDRTMETMEGFIEREQEAYDTAPETEDRPETDWTFHPEEYYSELTDFKPEGNESIEVDTVYNTIPYTFSVSNRRNDFYLNSLFAYWSSGYISATNVEDNLFRYEYSYDIYPTDEQIAAAKAKAEELLQAFDIGEWEIDRCSVKQLAMNPDVPRYTIVIRAVPIINGTAVVRQTQLNALRYGAENGLNWYYTDASFEFGVDNTLYMLELQSPMTILGTEETEVISLEEAEKALQAGLEEKNVSYIFATAGISSKDLYIYQLKTGYTRVGDASGNFRYVPSLTAMAALEDKTVYGEPLDLSDPNALYALITISLIDGSVIPTINS